MNILRHLLQPRHEQCPRKPDTFRLAGISQAVQEIANLTVTGMPYGDETVKPVAHAEGPIQEGLSMSL